MPRRSPPAAALAAWFLMHISTPERPEKAQYMPSRFEFERAIRRSELPPLARLLALVIATWADADSGEISTKNQPAQSVLLEATGMSKGSLLTHRKTLIDAGWIKCASPDKIRAQKEHAQNVYSIHVPGEKARSATDPAFSGKSDMRDKARSVADPAKSDMSDRARSATDLAKTDRVGHAPEKLGQPLTTRVFPSTTSYLQADEGGQGKQDANNGGRIPNAFDYCQPLIKAMTEAGFNVSWTMTPADWQSVARVVERAGVDQMVKFARGAKSREPIRFATFFLKGGWTGLAPKSTRPPASSESKPPWCGDPACDEITRRRPVRDANGLRSLAPCQQCHPSRKESAA